MTATTCILMTLGLCVAPAYKPVVEHGGFLRQMNADGTSQVASAEAVARLGVKITILHSDEIYTVPARAMNHACMIHWCVYYRKHCDWKRRVCIYRLGGGIERSGAITVQDFSIAFDSVDHLKEAEQQVAFVSEELTAYFGVLTRESPSIDVERCPGARPAHMVQPPAVEGCE